MLFVCDRRERTSTLPETKQSHSWRRCWRWDSRWVMVIQFIVYTILVFWFVYGTSWYWFCLMLRMLTWIWTVKFVIKRQVRVDRWYDLSGIYDTVKIKVKAFHFCQLEYWQWIFLTAHGLSIIGLKLHWRYLFVRKFCWKYIWVK